MHIHATERLFESLLFL